MMPNNMMGNMANNMMMNNNSNMNFENMNLIEFINLSIIINHHPHPLLFCNTLDRSNYGTNWTCNICFTNFTYDQPSFYCTFCDFDVCKNCIGNLKINDIKFHDFCKNKLNIPFLSNGNYKWTIKNNNHAHLLTKIKRKNDKFSWFCNLCGKNYLNINPSYYCSLCDYDICLNCFYKNSDSNQEMINPFYIGINPQMLMNNPYFTWYNNTQNLMQKPVIYLYPEKLMEIKIQLNPKDSKFSVVYPKFNEINNTWKVEAEPNGEIIINDKKYPYLFYELESYVPQLQNEGFLVKDEEAEQFLENKLKILGLNNKESTDFITFWLPTLLKNKISLCTFQNETFFKDFELNIEPKPETLIRIFLSIKKIDSIPDVKEQKLEKIERRGFTVIEWGGSIFNN